MRIVRGVFAVVLLLGGALVLGFALLEAGARHGYVEFRADRLFSAKAFPFTGGGGVLAFLGIACARTGKHTVGLLGGIPAALAAVGLGGYGLTLANHQLQPGIPWFVACAGLAISAAIFLARR